MQTSHPSKRSIKALLTSTLLLSGALSLQASAQDLSVAGNTFSVANSTTAIANPTVASNGIISSVTGVPTQATTLTVPTFGFTLQQTSVVDGNYGFRVGVVVDDDNSSRRLEMELPSMVLNVSGGVLSGTVAGSQVVKVLGRSGDGSVDVSGNFTDDASGSTAISGSSVSFNANTILNDIVSSNGGTVLADIINTINTTAGSGKYTYKIFVKQTSGTDLRFGTFQGPTYVPFPRIQTTCAANTNSQTTSQFLINSNQLASSFDMAYGVQGTLHFAGATGASGTGPQPFSESCVVSTPTTQTPEEEEKPLECETGYSGADCSIFTPEETTTAATEIINNIDPTAASEDDIEDLETALVVTADLAKNTAKAVEDGDADTTQVLNVISTLGNGLDTMASVSENDGVVSKEVVTDSLESAATVLNALADSDEELTNAQKDDVETFTNEAVEAVAVIAKQDTTTQEQSELKDGVEDVVNAGSSATGVVTKETQDVVADLVDDLLETSSQQCAAGEKEASDGVGGTICVAITDDSVSSDPALAAEIVKENSVELQNQENVDIEVESVEIQSETGMSEDAALSVASAGEVYTVSVRLTIEDTSQHICSTVDAISSGLRELWASQLGRAADELTLSTCIETALLSLPLRKPSDNSTSSDSVAAEAEDGVSLVFATNVSIVPGVIPEGTTQLPNGNELLAQGDIGIVTTPAPANLTAFALGLSDLGVTFDLQPEGGLLIRSDTVTASATFGFDSVDGVTGAIDSGASFTGPSSGDESDVNYYFTVNYADGSSEKLQPAIADDSLFDAINGYGYTVAADRSTGIITIDGVGDFRPGYLLTPNGLTEIIALAQGKDEYGFSYNVADMNGDGIADVEILSTKGHQLLYGLP